MLNRILSAILGVALVAIGLAGALQGGFYSTFYAHYIDFGTHNKAVGFAVVALGGAFVFLALKSQKNRTADSDG
jgi:hypothetical protein